MSPKPSMLQPALIGGVALGVVSAIPVVNWLNCLCCALVIGGAILSVHLYSKDYPADLPPVNYGDGALVGALAGAIGGAVYTIVGFFVSMAFVGAGAAAAQLLAALEEANIDVPDQVAAMMATGGLTFVGALVSLPFAVVFTAAIGALGGLLGIAILSKQVPPPPSAQSTVPPPPPGPPSAEPGAGGSTPGGGGGETF